MANVRVCRDKSSHVDQAYSDTNTHETSLDLTVIEQLSQVASPLRFSGEWLVRLDTHYLGGGRHFGSWEIADLGVLVVFRRRGVVERVKVALLQSKRL